MWKNMFMFGENHISTSWFYTKGACQLPSLLLAQDAHKRSAPVQVSRVLWKYQTVDM